MSPSNSRSNKRGSYPDLHRLVPIRPPHTLAAAGSDKSHDGSAHFDRDLAVDGDEELIDFIPRARSYLDLRADASSVSNLARSTSAANIRGSPSSSIGRSQFSSRTGEPSLAAAASELSTNQSGSNTGRKRHGKQRLGDEEAPYFLGRLGSTIMRSEMGSRCPSVGRLDPRDPPLHAYMAHGDIGAHAGDIRQYQNEPKYLPSRPVSRVNSQTQSRCATRQHSRRPSGNVTPGEDPAGMFSLSRSQTRSSVGSGLSAADSLPERYKNMVPDFVNEEDRILYEQMLRESQNDAVNDRSRIDHEDDDEIRMIKESKLGFGLDKIVDRLTGVTLYDPDEEQEVKVRERRGSNPMQTDPDRINEWTLSNWSTPAWILSFVAKVVM